MLPAVAADKVDAIADRVRRYRFRDAERYLEDVDALAAEFTELARELRAAPVLVFQAVTPAPANDGPFVAPAVVVSGFRQVIVSRVRPSGLAAGRPARTATE